MLAGRIGIIGSGSIGLYYGGRLLQAGSDVHFLMRSGLEEVRTKGLRIYSGGGDFHAQNPQVYADTHTMGPCDLVIVALKATSNPALESLIPPLLKDDTILLTLQNGLGNEEFLAERWGEGRVLGGLCFVCLTRRDPVTVDHVGQGVLSLGEYRRAASDRLQRVVDGFRETGIKTYAGENLAHERWRKLVWNIPFNGLSVAAGGLTVDRILADPELKQETIRLMNETRAIAEAEGHDIPADFVDLQIKMTQPMGAYQPSTLVDWKAGRILELQAIWEEPLRRAEALGVDTPSLRRLCEALRKASAKSV